MTTPAIIECPRGMIWLSVAVPTSTKLFSVKAQGIDDALAQLVPEQMAPAFFNPSDISSYWATASGTTLLVRRQILCLYHPVSWKDEEIILARDSLLTHGVLPCALDSKGHKCITLDNFNADIHVEVCETIDIVAERIAAAAPQRLGGGTGASSEKDRFFVAFDKLVKSSVQRILDEAKKP